jgi:hypothetical protein
MKLDKETFSKQRFWFALGGFVLLFLIALFTAKASVPGKIQAEKKKYDEPNAGLDKETKGDPKNDSFWKPWDAQADFLKGRISVVHGDAWKLQNERIKFPGSQRVKLDEWWTSAEKFEDWYKRINEGTGSDAARDDYRDRLYKQQFYDLDRQLRPEDKATKPADINLAKMLSPVEFKGGLEGFSTMMAPTIGTATGGGFGPPGPGERRGGAPMIGAREGAGPGAGGRGIDNFFTRRPTPEEVWYAQEDFWVKSEMLYAVRRTLDSVGKMTREEPGFWANLGQQAQYPDRRFTPYEPIQGRADTGRHYVPEAENRFRNVNWEMHLAFEEDDGGNLFVSGHSTLRNVNPGHRVQAGTGTGPVDKDTKETKAALLFRLIQRKPQYKLSERGMKALRSASVPDKVLAKLQPIQEKDVYGARKPLDEDLKKALSAEELQQFQDRIVSTMKYEEEKPKSWTLKVKTQDLPWNAVGEFSESKELKKDEAIDPRQPFEIEQVFDWRSAPVRRIDDILTCYHAHRDAKVQLKAHKILAKPPEDKPGDAGAPGAAAPVPPPGPQPGPGGVGDMGAAGPMLPQPTEANGLERNRYLNVTDTCRDMPFAVVVVLEQQHLHDFLVQLANSNLRIQITQVHFTRVRNVGPTMGDETAPMDPMNIRPGRPPGPPRGERGERGERGSEGAPQVADGAADPNLIEVSIYGIAALYEKFSPPKPPEDAAKADAPKADAPKADAPKTETPKP